MSKLEKIFNYLSTHMDFDSYLHEDIKYKLIHSEYFDDNSWQIFLDVWCAPETPEINYSYKVNGHQICYFGEECSYSIRVNDRIIVTYDVNEIIKNIQGSYCDGQIYVLNNKKIIILLDGYNFVIDKDDIQKDFLFNLRVDDVSSDFIEFLELLNTFDFKKYNYVVFDFENIRRLFI